MTHSLHATLHSTQALIEQYLEHQADAQSEDARWAVDAYQELVKQIAKSKTGRVTSMSRTWHASPVSKPA